MDPYRSVEFDVRRANDERNLRLLSVAHSVVAACTAVFSCLFVVHVVLGVSMLRSPATAPAGGMFIVLGVLAVLLGWALAGALWYAGRCISRRRRHTLCLVVAGVSCALMPFGTALGVVTLVLLTNVHVRMLFDEGSVPVAPLTAAVHAGWTSPEAKRLYTGRAAGILGGLLVLQFAVFGAFVVSTMAKALGRPLSFPSPASATAFGDRMFYIERDSRWHRANDDGPTHLASFRADRDEATTRGPDLPHGSRFLAVEGDALWVLGGEAIARYEGGRVTTFPAPRRLNWPTPPFVDDGRLALLDWSNGWEFHLMVLDSGEWRAVPGASWRTSASLTRLVNAWSVLPVRDGFDVFVQSGTDLRWRHIVIGDAVGDPREWELVTSPTGWWTATLVDGEPVVLRQDFAPFANDMQVLRRDGARWSAKANLAAHSLGAFKAIPLASGGLRLVLAAPGAMTTMDVALDGTTASPHRHATNPLQGFPVDVRLVVACALLLGVFSLVTGALLARLMRRDRTDECPMNVAPGRFASLFQRGLAYGLDQTVLLVITLPGWWPWSRWAGDPTTGMATTWTRPMTMLLVGSAVGWVGASLLATWMEGRWGMTPGKWILRIKVIGVDGQPCGFGRALVRRVGRLCDGFFGFAPGMAAVAFTQNWQRLGDLAARTVVVRSQ